MGSPENFAILHVGGMVRPPLEHEWGKFCGWVVQKNCGSEGGWSEKNVIFRVGGPKVQYDHRHH